ncbi:acyclic terpene utilization AtuA family protein [Janthinobacterium aquaticum]|uniref:acyclic terpene utilization AtuA family protein n=1 Tax=Janthinobacterium sp. FT58W TaxID=2654254 RepID=UPI0012656B97|nr:acyclic terpene utilization AtuA family protein [Janthinobacterium sp. FT58W]KAB8036367.1 acyclic terpene utilization AtuA family protein [Janthinobacterium sp. FT58W]
MNTIRIGAGAGYSGDRIEPAVELAEYGQLDYLIFECLAERTIALAQQARRKDPEQGYDPLLEERMRAVLRPCHANGVRILTNMGAANPLTAARKIRQIARELGLPDLRVAAVTGDDVLALVTGGDYLDDSGAPVAQLGDRLLSANAYLGAQPLVDALAQGADVIVTGRIADPALVLAPLIHAFGWAMDDWHKLGQGTLAGHLLECAGQVSGGYFADPGYKDVANLARLGFPIAEIDADGSLVITKVAGSGGAVTVATCTEQLLYEIHDPAAYLTPDVVADFSHVSMTQLEPDRVAVAGATGHPKSGLLKVTLGYLDSHIGEGQISYAGPGALARAQLAQAIVAERLQLCGVQTEELRFDMIGVNAIYGAQLSNSHGEPYEVRLRVTGRTASLKEAARIGNEVETLYTCGPSGGGGATKSAREVVAVRATLVDGALVHPTIHFGEQ